MLQKELLAPFVKLSKPGGTPAVGTVMQAIGFGRTNNYITEDTITDSSGNTETVITGQSPPRLHLVNLTRGAAGVPPCPQRQKNPSSSTWLSNDYVYEPKEICLTGNFFYTSENDAGVGIKSACSGDSGGPVFYGNVQYGIAGRVLDKTLCENMFVDPFTIYTKVSAHRKDFIDPIMKKYGK